MSHLSIDGQNIRFAFNNINIAGNVRENVIQFLKDNKPFILHDGNRRGPIFIPSKLACINTGEILIHSGVNEFQFTLSWECGLYEIASSLQLQEVEYAESKLLPYAATKEGHTP